MNPYVESCRSMVGLLEHVKINKARLSELARRIVQGDLSANPRRGIMWPDWDDARIVQYMGVLNAINFCFTDFVTGEEFDAEYPDGSGQILRGVAAARACLKRAYEEDVLVLNPEFLSRLTVDQLRGIFRGYTAELPMPELRVLQLQGCGGSLAAYGGEFWTIFEEADFRVFNDGRGIVERLVRDFPCYYDVSVHPKHKALVEFHKRAQLFALMYQGRALSSNGALPLLKDPENIGPIADYEVPKVFRHSGCFVYDATLAAKVDHGEILSSGSQEEVEIRLATVLAGDVLLHEVNLMLEEPVTEVELDNAKWALGRDAPGRHHLTPTTAY